MAPKSPRVVNIPISGDVAYNQPIHTVVGGLVISSAQAESVFLTILRHLTRRDDLSAAIIWHSFRGSNKSRLDLLLRLGRERLRDAALLKELAAACRRFIGLTNVRNFYCHSLFRYDKDGRIFAVQGVQLTYEDDPVKITNKRMSVATLNEITDATRKLIQLSRTTWALSDRIADELEVPREPRPE